MSFGHVPFNGDTYLENEFLRLRDLYKVKYVIETGTHLGMSAEWLCKNFEHVQTVEINEDYLMGAYQKLAPYKNVEIYKGDSLLYLNYMLEKVPDDEQVILFIDDHWYENPMIRELQIIAESGKKPIIAIHDFKNPHHPDYGFDAYPDQGITYEWEWVRPHIEAIYGVDGFEHYFNNQATGAKRGCVFILPKP